MRRKAFFDQCMTFSPKPPYDPNETVARIYDVYKEWCKDYNSGYSKTMKAKSSGTDGMEA